MVPGVESTIEVSWRVMRLISVDFPAFMTPKTPMLIRCTSLPFSVEGPSGEGGFSFLAATAGAERKKGAKEGRKRLGRAAVGEEARAG